MRNRDTARFRGGGGRGGIGVQLDLVKHFFKGNVLS